MFHFDVPVELTITKGKSFFDKSQLDKVILQTGFTSQMIVSHKKWAFGIIRVRLVAKELGVFLGYKRTFSPHKSIKTGLQKPAQISVHKCVQNLLKNQPG